MPRFQYVARSADGSSVNGSIEAQSIEDAADKISQRNLTPIQIDDGHASSQGPQTLSDKIRNLFKGMQGNIPYKDVVFFTRQLATMVSGGVTLARALSQLSKSEKPAFQKVINAVGDDISAGYTFADAIAKHPGAFNPMFVSVTHAGEIAGALDRTLDELATYMESVEAMRAKVKGAMRYPVFILGFVTLLVIGIMWKLVPVFSNMYASMGATLPFSTQMLVLASNLIKGNFFFLAVGVMGCYALFRYGMTKEEFKFQVHRYMLKVPVFGMILQKNIWGNFSRTMALLMECGIPILQATDIVSEVVGNRFYQRKLKDVYEDLRKGDLLSTSLEKTKVYPALICQLVATGEESGKVDALLRKAADFYEREIRVTVDSLASVIEPFLIICLGGIVGSILIALYMPIFKMGQILQ